MSDSDDLDDPRSLEVSDNERKSKMLAQRPIPLVLMTINSCSYSTSNLIFINFQILKEDLSWCLVSTKNSKSSFEAITC